MVCLKKIISLILAAVMILSSLIVVVSAEENNESQTETTTAVTSKKTLYRSRKKKYATTYYISKDSYYKDWTIYKTESINEKVVSRYNVVPNDIGGRTHAEWKDLYPSPDYTTELIALKMEYSTGPVYNTKKDGSGINIYRSYWCSNSSHATGSECSVNGQKVYHIGSVKQVYDFYVYAKTRYYIWSWGDWSDWSETPITASDEVEVETKETNVLYRSKKKIYTTSKTTLDDSWTLYDTKTQYEHSSFATIILDKDETIDETYCVHSKESATRYRTENGQYLYLTYDEWFNYVINNGGSLESAYDGYKYKYTYCRKKTPYTMYYYYKWEDWSEWSFTPVTENDDTLVETKFATMYISYDANGGTGAPEITAKEYDETVVLSETVPVRESYQFLGWSTTQDGAVEYLPGAEYSGNDDVTLFAVWKNVTEYSITFDANGGTGCPEGQIKVHDDPLVLSDTVSTRKGYTFIGWSQDKNATAAEYVPGGEFNINADTTLYAVWEKGCDGPHTYASTVVEPSCTYEGFTVHICVWCNYTYTDNYVETIDHTTEIRDYCAPTCEYDGYTGNQVCTVCSTVVETGEPILATGHEYSATVTLPTCTEEGYTEYVCIICGHTYTDDYVEIVDHSYETSILKKPDADIKGAYDATCAVCGHYVTAVLPAINDEDYTIEIVEHPKCVEEGLTIYILKNETYGKVAVEVVTESTGHSYEFTVTPPTCTKGGYTEFICENCNDSYTADLTNALGHSIEDGVCTACGEEVTEGAGSSGGGDINGDGQSNAMDMNLLKRIVVGRLIPSDEALREADINGDGIVNSIDSNLLNKQIAGGT